MATTKKTVKKVIREDGDTVLEPKTNDVDFVDKGDIHKDDEENEGADTISDKQAARPIDDMNNGENKDNLEGLTKFEVVESIYADLLALSATELKARAASIKESVAGKKVVALSESTKKILETVVKAEEIAELPQAFKAAIEETVNAKVSAGLKVEQERILAHTKTALTEKAKFFEAKLGTNTKEVTKFIIEKVDSYLDEVVANWLTENKVAIESGARRNMLENFYRNSVGAIRASGIDADITPEIRTKVKALSEAYKIEKAKNAKLVTETNKAREQVLESKKKMTQLTKASIFETATTGLTDVQKEKVKTIAKGTTFETMGDFQKKLGTIVEGVITKQPAQKATVIREDLSAVTQTAAQVISSRPVTQQDPFNFLAPGVR